MLRRAESIGVFQLEGAAMRQTLRALAPTSFDDVAALVALYRPGPMAANMHRDYPELKNGRKELTYLHPDIEPILKDTYGLMLYQESVMRVAQKFAGYSLEEADNLRKACGKKIRKLIAAEREKFVAGCITEGYGEELGTQLFDIIEPFADYAFNKSHSYGYGLVAYQTAWLKAHYPVEYMSALLTSVKDNKDKTAVYLAECRSMGIDVLVPDVNRSLAEFAPDITVDEDGEPPARAVHRLRPGRGAQRRREPGGADRGRTQRQRRLRGHLRLLRPGRPGRPEQADHGVAGQGGSVRLARPPAPGLVPRPRVRRRPHDRAPQGAGPGHHVPLRRVRGRAGRPGLGWGQGGHPRQPSSTRPSAWPSRRRCSAST